MIPASNSATQASESAERSSSVAEAASAYVKLFQKQPQAVPSFEWRGLSGISPDLAMSSSSCSNATSETPSGSDNANPEYQDDAARKQTLYGYANSVLKRIRKAFLSNSDLTETMQATATAIETFDHNAGRNDRAKVLNERKSTKNLLRQEVRWNAERRAAEPHRSTLQQVMEEDMRAHRAQINVRLRDVESKVSAMNSYVTKLSQYIEKKLETSEKVSSDRFELLKVKINELKHAVVTRAAINEDFVHSFDSLLKVLEDLKLELEGANAHNLHSALHTLERYTLAVGAVGQLESTAIATSTRATAEDGRDLLFRAFCYTFPYIAAFEVEPAVNKHIRPDSGIKTTGFLDKVRTLYKFYNSKTEQSSVMADFIPDNDEVYAKFLMSLHRDGDTSLRSDEDKVQEQTAVSVDKLFRFFIPRLHGTMEFHYVMFTLLKRKLQIIEERILKQLGTSCDLSSLAETDPKFQEIFAFGPLSGSSSSTSHSGDLQRSDLVKNLSSLLVKNLGARLKDFEFSTTVEREDIGLEAMLSIDYNGPEDIPLFVRDDDRKRKSGMQWQPKEYTKFLESALSHSQETFRLLYNSSQTTDELYLKSLESTYLDTLKEKLPLGITDKPGLTASSPVSGKLTRLRVRCNEHRERLSCLYSAIKMIISGVPQDIVPDNEILRNIDNQRLHNRMPTEKPDRETAKFFIGRYSNILRKIPADRQERMLALYQIVSDHKLYGTEFENHEDNRWGDYFELMTDDITSDSKGQHMHSSTAALLSKMSEYLDRGAQKDFAAVEPEQDMPEQDVTVEPEQDVPVESEQDVPVESEQDVPVEPEQDVTVEPEQDVPVESEQDVPVEPEQDVTVEPEQDVPVESEQDVPVEPEQDVPVEPEQDVPVESEQDVTVEPEQDVTVEPEQDVPVESEQDVPVELKQDGKSWPRLSDMPQILGFSWLYRQLDWSTPSDPKPKPKRRTQDWGDSSFYQHKLKTTLQ